MIQVNKDKIYPVNPMKAYRESRYIAPVLTSTLHGFVWSVLRAGETNPILPIEKNTLSLPIIEPRTFQLIP
jgi:hypothetical protein